LAIRGERAGTGSPRAIIVAPMNLRTVAATRYVTPLREGGSLPAIVEGDDAGLYVVKFRGAGQGSSALVAELVAGEIARALGLPVPEIVLVTLDADLARTEPDPEIQDLIRASAGLNLALDYLPGAAMFDALADPIDAALASKIVWFDAFVSNVDRTPRNPNLLVWHRRPWLIDHGAALYFHHGGTGYRGRAADRFAPIADHALLPLATSLPDADAVLPSRLSPAIVRDILALVPDDWLVPSTPYADASERRAAYDDYLLARLHPPRAFFEEAAACASRARTTTR